MESGERKQNRLASQTSPYLLQHATNPVDWYPWGEEAIRKARELDRPIFLSIGYSSCHWCHVMERESFENAEIAKMLNDRFVSIKVDREERPDLDAIYMTAVQVLTGSGGWPLSVFLTPQLRPFWGGTYFPPESRYGRPGFGQVLTQIADAYTTQRVKLEEAAEELTRYVRETETARGEEGEALIPGDGVIRAAIESARQAFDAHHGGFGGAPKFPRSIEIAQLLRHHVRTGDATTLDMAEKTLEGMARGGMYDQVGGGFHRYSTDERWLVPHFEKMLYDNALLTRAYLEAFQVTGKDLYRTIAGEILDYVLRDMTGPDGGFFSATDADSDGEEGKFFVWTPEEVEAVLGKEDARVVCGYYGITPGGNFEHRTSIPHVARPVEAVAKALGADPEEARRIVARGRVVLREARDRRPKPFRDEKVITAWNALMISALSRGHQVLEDQRYLEAARRATGLILEKLCVSGRLQRAYKDGRTSGPGFLDDHAFMVEALLDLYEATFDVSCLRRARELADELIATFWDSAGGGFLFAAPHHDNLIARKTDFLDSSTPAGSGVATLSLLRLERLTGRGFYRQRAEASLKGLKGSLERWPMALGSTILALDFYLHPPVEVALVGDLGGSGGRELLRTVHRRLLPSRIVAGALGSVSADLAREVPLLAGKTAVDGKAAAYVCKDFACKAPVTTPEALAAALGD